MNLLENQLIRKYFGCGASTSAFRCKEGGCDCPENQAYRILQSMKEPIKKGERYLSIWDKEAHMVDVGSCTIENNNPWHPNELRLPDRFQKQQCVHCFCRVNRTCCYCKEPKPSSETETCVECYNPPCSKHSKPKETLVNSPQVPSQSQVLEEKIDSIIMQWSKQDNLIKELRELVALARRDI